VTRVLFVQGAAERGGAERALLILCRYLPRFGIDPVIAFLADGPFVDEVRAAGVAAVHLPPPGRARHLWRAPDVARAIAAAAKETEASVVQASGEKMAIYAGWAARDARCASVFWLHDAPLRDAKSAAVQLAMACSPHDAAVAGSKWMAEAFRRRLGIKVRTIHYGVDLETLPAQPADILGLTGWPAESTIVAHVGRLQRWKGAEVFLRAAARAARRHPRARFLVVGGALYGWERQYAEGLPHLAADLGIGDRVHFTGHVADVLPVMAACDIIVHSSLRPEPMGIVVTEAMALGRAVVASRTLGPEEVVEDGRTGLLVPPGDDRRLAQALEGLLGSGEKRSQLGAAAAEAIPTFFSATNMVEEFCALYHTLAASDATRRRTRRRRSDRLPTAHRGALD
jgi:glycosyltransferase involved in cell wall biosynthesis